MSVLLPQPSLTKPSDVFPRKIRIMHLVSCVSFLKIVLKYRFFIPQRKILIYMPVPRLLLPWLRCTLRMKGKYIRC